jgi:hypothetical protein
VFADCFFTSKAAAHSPLQWRLGFFFPPQKDEAISTIDQYIDQWLTFVGLFGLQMG